jgi:hypothetical protein
MTAVFKQLKSPTLSIVLQLTERTAPGAEPRVWEVHDVERNRGFKVTLSSRTGSAGEAQIEAAIGLAVERALTTPPEKVAGVLYDVEVSAGELKAARG